MIRERSISRTGAEEQNFKGRFRHGREEWSGNASLVVAAKEGRVLDVFWFLKPKKLSLLFSG